MKESLANAWVRIISAIKGKLSFFVLVVLVLQVILVSLAPRAQGADFTILLVGSIVLMLVTVLVVAFTTTGEKAQEPTITIPPKPMKAELIDGQVERSKYDVFVSSAMAALSEKDFLAERQNTLAIVNCLRNECGKLSVFYAGEFIESKGKFEPPALSVERDIEAIEDSEYFLLVYLKKKVSSVLFEAGVALALGKKCIYFVTKRRDLPFLMQYASEVFRNVKIYEVRSAADVIRLLSKVGVLEWE